MNKHERKLLAEETLQIIEDGYYTNKSGAKVSIESDLKNCIQNTQTFKPDHTFFVSKNKEIVETEYEVLPISTLKAAEKYVNDYKNVTVLNFASAKNPGGGFLKGSSAQEESIARCSALYKCINGSEFYEYNRNTAKSTKGLYSNYVIYSPKVPVFRDDMEHGLLDNYYCVNVITSPAVNAKHHLKLGGSKDSVEVTMRDRMYRIVKLASSVDTDVLVLGAFGCGVFGNNIGFVAKHWRTLLDSKFKGHFKKVVFGVLGKNFKRFKMFFERGGDHGYIYKEMGSKKKPKAFSGKKEKTKNKRGKGSKKDYKKYY